MDAGEFFLVLLVSVVGGVVSVFLLKEVLSDFIVSQLIDNLESMVIQIDSAMPIPEDSAWADVQNRNSSNIPFYFGLIRFTVGFVSVFGLCLCIKTFLAGWF